MCEYIDKYFFRNWEKRGRNISVNDMFTSLGIRNKKWLKRKYNRKREILNLLANEIEGLKEEFKSTTYSILMDDVQYMLNNLNIRHNNLEGKYKKQYVLDLSNNELEELYDLTFDMILSIFTIDRYLKSKTKVEELKKNIK